MIIRSRIFITAVLVCHVLLADRIVTSQTLPPASTPSSPPAVAKRKEDVTIRAVEQEKDGAIYHLRGNGEILYRNYTLRADKVDYNSDTGGSELEGHVLLDGGPYQEHIEASHGTYNINTETGTFYAAVGTVGFRPHKTRFMLTTTNPFAFLSNFSLVARPATQPVIPDRRRRVDRLLQVRIRQIVMPLVHVVGPRARQAIRHQLGPN